MSISVNGILTSTFAIQRGLRQGCPLSQYLFIIRQQGLSSILSKMNSQKMCKGIAISRDGLQISHLMFADDCILFMEATSEYAQVFSQTLYVYTLLSGQQINGNKSIVVFSPNTESSLKENIASILGLNNSSKIGHYLGINLDFSQAKRRIFNNIKNRIFWRISNCKTASLSIMGRITLAKHALSMMAQYTLGVFKLSKSVGWDIDRCIAKFIWIGDREGRGIHWKS